MTNDRLRQLRELLDREDTEIYGTPYAEYEELRKCGFSEEELDEFNANHEDHDA